MLRGTVLAIPLALGACAGVATPTNEANIAVCVGALVATGASDAGTIVAAALATPACQALAADVLKQIIVNVEQGQATAMRTGRRR